MKTLALIGSITVGLSAFAGEIHDAVRAKDMAAVKKLIAARPAMVNEQNENQLTPLHVAAMGGDVELVKFLLNNKAEACAKTFQGYTPLHNAASIANLEIVKLLVNANPACVNETNRAGMTPLFSACGTNAEVTAFLIASKANVNAHTPDGTTPLHVAALKRHADCVALLLKNGASVNARDNQGNNAAHLDLSKVKNPHKEVLQVLIAYKIDLNARGLNGAKVLDLAQSLGDPEVVQYLKQHGAK